MNFADGGYIAQVLIWIVDHDQIHLTALQQLHTFNGGLIDDFDVGIREFFVKPFQIGNQKITADSVAGTDANLAAGGGAVQKLVFPTLNQIHGGFNMA